jgi:hypothetical protein
MLSSKITRDSLHVAREGARDDPSPFSSATLRQRGFTFAGIRICTEWLIASVRPYGQCLHFELQQYPRFK